MDYVELTVEVAPEQERVFRVERGTILRTALLDAGISPYTRWTRKLNCGGRGLCATCGVYVRGAQPEPTHWHDGAAAKYGYPRLACQVRVDGPMCVSLVHDKIVWGARDAHPDDDGSE